MMEETLEKCIPPKSILLQILQGLAPNQANVTGLLNFWAAQNSGSDQISPPRSVALVCERRRTSANAERMLNYYWAN